MSPRRARRRDGEPRPLLTGTIPTTVEQPDGEWMVRNVTAAGAVKTYRCPGCSQEVPPGVAHVVAWRPREEDHRRHWHTPCWSARLHRRPR